jgi:MYXO-CTERM domain-containing protein
MERRTLRTTTRLVALAMGLGLSTFAGASSADEATDDFAARCASPEVVKCVGFDDPADIAGDSQDNSGILSGASTPALDGSTRASGASSILFTIPSNSAADTSGSYFTNFSADLSVQFGESDELWVQWRQRFSPEYLTTAYPGGGGWKQVIVGTGDQPGQLYYSCTDLEVVTVNGYHRGFPTMYNSCSGSASHGPYDGFEEPFGSYDFLLQNGRPEPHCLYSQGQTDPPSYFPPTGNCFGYAADEWMTFQVGIKTGPRVGDEFADSHVELWVAREGLPSELVMDWGPYNLTAGDPALDQRFGKVWFLPYNTGKDAAASHPVAYTWYDELIVSAAKLPDPGAPPSSSSSSGASGGGGPSGAGVGGSSTSSGAGDPSGAGGAPSGAPLDDEKGGSDAGCACATAGAPTRGGAVAASFALALLVASAGRRRKRGRA